MEIIATKIILLDNKLFNNPQSEDHSSLSFLQPAGLSVGAELGPGVSAGAAPFGPPPIPGDPVPQLLLAACCLR